MVRRRSRADLFMVLAYGATCQIAQVVILRELLMVFHGNEFSLGIILAAWMVWGGIGSRLGARMAAQTARPHRLLAAYAVGILVVLPATVVIIRMIRGAFDLPPGAYLSVLDMTVACLVVMAPAGLLLGGYFVLLSRLRRGHLGVADTTATAHTYIGEAVGNVFGGLMFTLALVHLVAPLPLLALCGALLLSGFALAPVSPRRRSLLLLSLGAIVVATLAAGGPLERYTTRLQWALQAPEYRLLESRQSRYGAITVLQRDDQVSFYQSGHLLFSTVLAPGGQNGPTPGQHSHTRDALDRSAGLEEQEAVTLAHLSMVQHPKPRSVLLIGGGLRGTLREISRYPVDRVDYVEIDDTLVETALPYLGAGTREALADPRVRLIHRDGRLFVKERGDRYDMIVVDVPDPATAVLNRYYTEEFFREAGGRLSEDGVLVIGATSTADLRGSAVANRNATIYHTLRRVFADVLPVGERSLVYSATLRDRRLTGDPLTLIGRYREAGVDSPAFSAAHFTVLLEPGLLRRVNWVLRYHGREQDSHQTAPKSAPLLPPSIEQMIAEEEALPPPVERFFINSDFRPIAYYHTLIFWNVLARGDHGAFLRWVANVEPWWIVPPIGMLLATTVILKLGSARPRRFAVLGAVFTTGMSTMALQVALLLAFQSIYGFVYEMVGLVVALFMAGLATGSAIVQQTVSDKARIGMLSAMQAAVAGLALVIAIVLPWVATLHHPNGVFVVFSATTFAAGALNGADFPLAAACYLAIDGKPERTTGTVYGVELFGACVGAALAGIVIAPVLGIVACCMLAAVANATACAQLLISG